MSKKVAEISISILLIISVLLLTFEIFDNNTIRDVFLAPAIAISIYLNIKNFKK